jgi:hypothetical protein
MRLLNALCTKQTAGTETHAACGCNAVYVPRDVKPVVLLARRWTSWGLIELFLTGYLPTFEQDELGRAPALGGTKTRCAATARSALRLMACSRYKCGMDGLRHCAPGSGWLTIVAASIALSPLLAGCSSLSSSSASSPAPEPGVASASLSSSPAAPSSSSASGTSAGTVKQSFVGFLKVFRDPEPDEVDAPAKIGAAQPQPGAPFSSSASSSARNQARGALFLRLRVLPRPQVPRPRRAPPPNLSSSHSCIISRRSAIWSSMRSARLRGSVRLSRNLLPPRLLPQPLPTP